MNNLPKTNDKETDALERISQQLLDKGLDEETVAFMAGRFVSEAVHRVLAKASELLSEAEIQEVQELDDEVEQQELLSEFLKQKTGKNADEWRAEFIDEQVRQFESLSNA